VTGSLKSSVWFCSFDFQFGFVRNCTYTKLTKSPLKNFCQKYKTQVQELVDRNVGLLKDFVVGFSLFLPSTLNSEEALVINHLGNTNDHMLH
jgi:hypothetical protein